MRCHHEGMYQHRTVCQIAGLFSQRYIRPTTEKPPLQNLCAQLLTTTPLTVTVGYVSVSRRPSLFPYPMSISPTVVIGTFCLPFMALNSIPEFQVSHDLGGT